MGIKRRLMDSPGRSSDMSDHGSTTSSDLPRVEEATVDLCQPSRIGHPLTSQPAGVVAFGIYESGADSLPVKHLMGVGTHTKREGYETCSDAPHDEAVFGGDGG